MTSCSKSAMMLTESYQREIACSCVRNLSLRYEIKDKKRFFFGTDKNWPLTNYRDCSNSVVRSMLHAAFTLPPKCGFEAHWKPQKPKR